MTNDNPLSPWPLDRLLPVLPTSAGHPGPDRACPRAHALSQPAGDEAIITASPGLQGCVAAGGIWPR
jgi:hypothetical protein